MAEAPRPSSGDTDAVAEGGFSEKCSPEVTQRVETLETVILLLWGTLDELSESQLQRFFTDDDIQRCIKYYGYVENPFVVVLSMVLAYGQQSVDKTKKVLQEMERTDLVGKLSDISSGPKEKQSVVEHWSSIHTVAVKRAVKELVVETLSDLSPNEFPKFKSSLHDFYIHRLRTCCTKPPEGVGLVDHFFFWENSQAFSEKLKLADKADELVELMVDVWGQMYVDVISKTLVDINRTDLQLRLSGLGSGPRESYCVDWPAWMEKEAETMASVIELLLETLAGLSHQELKEFLSLIMFKVHLMSWPLRSFIISKPISKQEVAFLMVLDYYKDPVEETKEMLQLMNRTDLVQRLSHSSSGPKKHRTALIQKVATVAAVLHVLWETLNGLNHAELREFKYLLPMLPKRYLGSDDVLDDIVDWMLEIFGSQSVEITRNILKKINREDLMKRLCVSSSGCKVSWSCSGDEAAVTIPIPVLEYMLSQKMKGFNRYKLDRFQWLLRLKFFMMGFSLDILQPNRWTMTGRDLLAKRMVEICGQQCREVFDAVLMEFTDLKAEEPEELQDELLEILAGLSNTELEEFKYVLKYEGKAETEMRDRLQIAKLMEKIYGLEAVEVTKRILQKNWMRSFIRKEPEELQNELMEILEGLSYTELEEFKHVLYYTKMMKHESKAKMEMRDRLQIAKLMEKIYGLGAVEVTKSILEKIQQMSSSGKGAEATKMRSMITLPKGKLVETLRELNLGELEEFKRYLQHTRMKKGLLLISSTRTKTADRFENATLITEFFTSLEVTKEVFTEMSRPDLVQSLLDSSSGSKGPLGSAEPEGCGSVLHDSSDWTKVEPEVSTTHEDDAPTYSLQSEAGNFECSVSGLRWVCTEKISFQYQFCCWETHVERIESLKYAPAGPMIDIKVITGKFLEVHLPHWVCIDVIPKISDKFAVLHIDDCGDVVEKVSEVTSHHVKLPKPDFSVRALLIKLGLSQKIYCNVVIYKTNLTFLTLNVYLLPADPGLKQQIDKTYPPSESRTIHKPQPVTAMKLRDRFKLTADMEAAEIYPENIELRYESPNFFEVFLKNPDTDFELNLKHINEDQPLWTCAIRKGDYQSSVQTQVEETTGLSSNPSPGDGGRPSGVNVRVESVCTGADFVDKHRARLIDRVSNINPILDELLDKEIVQQAAYGEIMNIPVTQDKMRRLYLGPLHAAGPNGKEIFFKALEEHEKWLVDDLKKNY